MNGSANINASPGQIINHSGLHIKCPTKLIPPLRNGCYHVLDKAVAGDAPKNFLRVYEPGKANKSRKRGWPMYIAKLGQKYYPNESITEHLLTRIGETLELKMAQSRLMCVKGQVRFLSKYFLKPQQSLVHGAEIFANHLSDDAFVQQVEDAKESRNIFTFQVAEKAIADIFQVDAAAITADFVRMLGFDVIVGNNDRHYYNWGVITDAQRKVAEFSPIFDTARALVWNQTEKQLLSWTECGHLHGKLSKYSERSQPKTGCDEKRAPNHFQLASALCAYSDEYREILVALYKPGLPDQIDGLIGTEFAGLISNTRRYIIVKLLEVRMEEYRRAIL